MRAVALAMYYRLREKKSERWTDEFVVALHFVE